MPNASRLFNFLVFRYPLTFPALPGGGSPDDNFLRVSLFTGDGARRIALSPIRFREGDRAAEWLLTVEPPFNVGFETRYSLVPRPPVGDEPAFRVDKPLSMTVGELTPIPGETMLTFLPTGGSLVVPLSPAALGANTDRSWPVNVAKMWPTGRFEDITHLHAEPSGAHLRGYLPAGFFPPGVEPRPVCLRLPRSSEDVVNGDPIWTLTGHVFGPDVPEARALVRGWSRSFLVPQLAAKEHRALRTPVDSVVSEPDETVTVRLAPLSGTGAERQLKWSASDLGTSVNLGGGGVASEATFSPSHLVGTATCAANDPRKLRQRTLRLEAPATILPDQPLITLTVDETADTATLVANAEVVPLVMPSTPVEPATPVDDQAPTARRRIWLCTEDGWASIDAEVATAELDSEAITEGPIAGSVGLDDLLRKLQEDPVKAGSGLSVEAQARASSAVSLEFDDRPGQGDARSRSLTLEIRDAMLLARTSRSFYQPPPPGLRPDGFAAAAPIVPALTGQVGPSAPAGSPTSDDVVRQLEATLGGPVGRFVGAVFVSTNVQKIAKGFDLRFLHSQGDGSEIPTSGKNLVIVADVGGTLRFRVFDAEGQVIEADAARLATQAGAMADLKKRLDGLRPPHILTRAESNAIVAAVTALVAAPLRALLSIRARSALEIERGLITLWRRPTGLPIARTYALDPDQDLGGFLDANRGLLPFRKTGGPPSLPIEFPPVGLPRVADEPYPVAADGSIALDAASAAFRLAAGWALACPPRGEAGPAPSCPRSRAWSSTWSPPACQASLPDGSGGTASRRWTRPMPRSSSGRTTRRPRPRSATYLPDRATSPSASTPRSSAGPSASPSAIPRPWGGSTGPTRTPRARWTSRRSRRRSWTGRPPR